MIGLTKARDHKTTRFEAIYAQCALMVFPVKYHVLIDFVCQHIAAKALLDAPRHGAAAGAPGSTQTQKQQTT